MRARVVIEPKRWSAAPHGEGAGQTSPLLHTGEVYAMGARWMVEARRRQSRAWSEPEVHRPEVVDEFGRWLEGFLWSWYVTLTFPAMIGPEYADREWSRWLATVEMWTVYELRGAAAVQERWRGAIYAPSLRDEDLARHALALWHERIEAVVGHTLRWARALEYQKRGVIHFHALLDPVRRDARRADAAALWRDRTGGRAQVQAYRPRLGATHYLGK